MEISGDQVVDRDQETTRFRGLLRDGDEARVLVVSVPGGRGKSTLLRKLRHHCEWVEGIPAALVALDELTEGDEFDLVERLAVDMSALAPEAFAAFDQLNGARRFKQSRQFIQSLTGIVEMDRPQFSGGTQVIGQVAAKTIQRIENLNLQIADDWSADHEIEARKMCVEAFFSDLEAFGVDQPFALLVDSVDEQAPPRLREWIFGQFLRNKLIQAIGRQRRWVVVLAGRPLLGEIVSARFGAHSPYAEWITLIEDLEWSPDDIGDFVRLHVGRPLPDAYVDTIVRFITVDRRPLNEAINLARLLVQRAS